MRNASRRPPCPILAGALLAVLAALSATGVCAQGISTSPPPVRASVDANGVDLITGALVVSTPQLSIGQGEGALVYVRNLTASGWVDNTIGTINVNGSAISVSFGGASDSFTLSGGVYTNAVGGGSTLTYSAGAQQYTYTTAAGVVVVFNATLPAYSPSYANGGRPITATYPDGMVTTFTYSTVTVSGTSAARLQSVNNSFGYQLKFTYANNSPVTVGDLVAWTTIASVSGVNNAVEYCSPTASTCTFVNQWPTVTYVTTAGAVTVTDPDGNVSFFTYNSSGLLVGIQRPGASGNTTGVYYSGGSGPVYSITNSAKVVGPGGAGPGTWYYGFSGTGTQTTTVTDPLGHQRVLVANTTTDLVASDKDALNRTTSYQYDSFGRLHQITWPEGNYAIFAYDARGNATSTTTYPSSGSGTIVTSAAFDTTCVQISKCNKPNTTTDANGNVTTYGYSPTTGQLTSVTGPPPTTGAVQPASQLSYTALYPWFIQASGGGVTQGPAAISLLTGTSTCQTLATCSGTTDQVVSTIAYGSSGVANNRGATSVTTASGTGTPSATASQTFDAYGNVATTVGSLGTAQTSVSFHDLNRNLLGVIGPLATGQTTYPTLVYTWSPNSQVTQITHGTSPNQTSLSSVTVLEQANVVYDGIGRKIQASFVSGGTTQTLSQWTYDNANRLVCTALRMNPATFASEPGSACVQGTAGSYGPDRVAFDSYDAADELTGVTLGYLTPQQMNYSTLTYSANGYVQTVADAKNNLTTLVYDGYDRVSQVEYPLPTTPGSSNPSDYEGYTWDSSSNLTVDRRRSADTVTFGYDALNRATSATFSANAAQNTTTSYDLLNRPLTVAYTASGGTSLAYGWDALSRLVSETIAGGGEPTGGRTISYAYDAAGDRTGITWPDTGANALTATYAYDILQRVTTISANGSVIESYGYDQYGRRSSIARNGGSGAATAYGYDGADRVSTLAQSLTGGAAVTWTMGYDPSGAIVSRQASNTSYLWHPGAASIPYAANGLDQYTAVGGATPAYTDGRANLTALSGSGPTFSFDTANDLLSASGPTAVSLAYDPTGRIQTKTSGGAMETFLYAGAMLVGEYASSGTILDRYIPGAGQDEAALVYAGAGTGTPEWLHADQQGSTIAWSNGSGASLGSQAYDPYGEPSAWTGPRYAYIGQLMIAEAQLYHYKARAYEPALGRFLQTDPAASDLNPYAYVANDPVNRSDPSGKFFGTDFFALGGGCTLETDYWETVTYDWQGDIIVNGYNASFTFGSCGGGGAGLGGGGGAIGGNGGRGKPDKGKGASGPPGRNEIPCVPSESPFSKATAATEAVHSSIYTGGAMALRQAGKLADAAALARAALPAGVGLTVVGEGVGAAQDVQNGGSVSGAVIVHGSGTLGTVLGGETGAEVGFLAGEAIFPPGGGIVGAVIGGALGAFAGNKTGELAGATAGSSLGICHM